MAYKSPYERKFGKKHPNNPAERKRKAEAAKPKPSKPKKKEEGKDNKRKRDGLAIQKLAETAGKSIKDWQKTADTESNRTMSLKDRLREKRNQRIRGK